jgi:cation:H+ antiporter
MNILLALLLLFGGLLILWKSAEILVAGAVGLAQRLGISSIVIGLTVVAMGTSAPELATSIAGVLEKGGEGGNIAIGNVFGSNIANLALIGGLVALIRPLVVQKQTLLREIPVMIVMELLLLPFLWNAHLSRVEAFILIVTFMALILITIHLARKESALNKNKQLISQDKSTTENNENIGEMVHTSKDGIKNTIYILIGLVGLAAGAEMALKGAIFIGTQIGLSKSVIGLTIIAFGTSLPELVTCVVAALKGHHDISVGNLVGSNIFNTLLVVGGAGLVVPFNVQKSFAGGIDYWIMIGISIAFALAVIIGRQTINRFIGLLLLCGYFGYLVYLFGYSR